LAGTFGGANYFASSNNVILIGSANSIGNAAWGGWTVRMLLSDDTYSSNSISYLNSVLVNNTNTAARLVTNNQFFRNSSGAVITSTNALFNTFYQLLDIAAFDTNNIGVKGIELSGMTLTPQFPDISYIGVTAVPEPSTYALLALSAAGLGGYVLRRRRK
jgi:fucose permease